MPGINPNQHAHDVVFRPDPPNCPASFRLEVIDVAQHCTLNPAHGPNSLGQCFEIVLVNNLCKEQGVRKHSLDDFQALCVAEAPPEFLCLIPQQTST